MLSLIEDCVLLILALQPAESEERERKNQFGSQGAVLFLSLQGDRFSLSLSFKLQRDCPVS